MQIGNYLRETRTELKHVSWPTRRETFVYTGLVIGISLLVAAFLGFFDVVFDYLLRFSILNR